MISATILRAQLESTLVNRIPAAFSFRSKPLPDFISTGVPELDRHSVGIPRGCLSEICGPTSSGRTTFAMCLLRELTGKGECCAWIDVSNGFDPLSAAANNVDLRRLLWIRCASPHPKLTPLDKALRAADLLINAGGFGLILLDLADIEPRLARKIPLASWYRYRRTVEGTSAALVVIEQEPSAKSCASLVLTLNRSNSTWMPTSGHCHNPELLTGAELAAHVSRSRLDLPFQRKSPGHASISFHASTAWTG